MNTTSLESIATPGHFFDMIAVRTPDGALFLGDSVISGKIIDKYNIFFLFDIRTTLETLENVKNIPADFFIPSHGDMTQDIKPLADKNMMKIKEISSVIKELCADKTTEEIHREMCRRYNIVLAESQYILTLCTLRSYLTYLSEKGEISNTFNDFRMIWNRSK